MAAFIKFLCVLFVVSLVGKGNCQCGLSNVSINQSKTGEVVQKKPVWNVTITNNCACSQSDLTLSCNGFQTVKPVDSSVLSKSGNECLVNNGVIVGPFSFVTFTYAWDTSFPFQTLSSTVNCS
ncbi:TPD1 protein homolog 1-like [Fagus crenata]